MDKYEKKTIFIVEFCTIFSYHDGNGIEVKIMTIDDVILTTAPGYATALLLSAKKKLGREYELDFPRLPALSVKAERLQCFVFFRFL